MFLLESGSFLRSSSYLIVSSEEIECWMNSSMRICDLTIISVDVKSS